MQQKSCKTSRGLAFLHASYGIWAQVLEESDVENLGGENHHGKGEKKRHTARNKQKKIYIYIYILYIYTVYGTIFGDVVWKWMSEFGSQLVGTYTGRFVLHPSNSEDSQWTMENGRSIDYIWGVSLNVGAQLLKWWGSPTNHGFSY